MKKLLKPLKSWLREQKSCRVNRQEVFTSIYARHGWAGQSVSGRGSDLDQTAVLRQELPRLLRQLGARRLLDAPCGDFNWMQCVSFDLEEYIGADIVVELVTANQQQYGNATRRFVPLDIVCDPLPTVDVILCRDCLVHLSYQDILTALQNFKRSGSTYLLTTTFPLQPKNWDISNGEWRGLNLQRAPFHFPNPIHLLNEQCPEIPDKCLGLWNLADLPLKG